MSTELIAIIGVGVTIIGVILNGQRTQQKNMDGLREQISGLRERMAYVEGLLEGLREAIAGRRVAVTEAAVAEDPAQYEQR